MSKITRKRWTDVEDSLLLELHGVGATQADMAKTLRRTQPAINARLCKLRKEPIDLGTFTPPKSSPKATQGLDKNVIASITIVATTAIIVAGMLAITVWG